MKPWASNRDKSPAERGYGSEWKRLRKQVLIRDGFLCRVCKKRAATECDHIVSKAKGGTDALENLQGICDWCHKDKTTKERNNKL